MKKGFTLIELLVVISVIGVLATIILSSLGSARSRAEDAKIKLLMNQIRNQAELFSLKYESYQGTGIANQDDDINQCAGTDSALDGTLFDPDISDSAASIMRSIFFDLTSDINFRVYCGLDRNRWAFAVPLNNPEPGTTGWCVDSTGVAKSINRGFAIADGGGGAGLLSCP